MLKTCLKCNARSKVERERYKCPHGRQKTNCRDCGGSSFYLHEHLRDQCRICSPKTSKASAELAHFYQKTVILAHSGNSVMKDGFDLTNMTH